MPASDVFGVLAGYSLAVMRFRGRGLVFGLMLLVQMVPFQLLMIPLYVMIVRSYGLGDNYLGMILPFAINSTGVFVFRQYFLQLPASMFEAARIDGANEWQVFWNVTRPRLAPVMMILVVLRFGSAMAVIDEYLIFGGFNRASPTYTWTMFMYDEAFKTGLWRQGFGAAIGMIGAVAMMFVVIFLLQIFRPRD